MLEFLVAQNSSESPTVLSILLAVLCSFFLSALIVITYEFTTKEHNRSVNFLQSLALIAMVATTVMQAIGDSLARGLGMLGALAIIRFRTRLNDPRNMTFMFASLAVGISCGVFGFTIAFVGTILFCLMAFVLRFTHFFHASDLQASLRIVAPFLEPADTRWEALLGKYCRKWSVEQYRINTVAVPATGQDKGALSEPYQVLEVNYRLAFKDRNQAIALLEACHKVEGIKEIRLRFSSTTIEA